MAKIKIPNSLESLTGNKTCLEVDAANVENLLKNVITKYPQLKDKIYDNEGVLSKFIAVYVNEQNIRALNGEKTPLKDTDTVYIVPPIAGG